MFEIKGVPAPGVHTLAAGCIDFPYEISVTFIYEHMDKMPGALVWLPLHPVCAQYKTLISNTAENHMVSEW